MNKYTLIFLIIILLFCVPSTNAAYQRIADGSFENGTDWTIVSPAIRGGTIWSWSPQDGSFQVYQNSASSGYVSQMVNFYDTTSLTFYVKDANDVGTPYYIYVYIGGALVSTINVDPHPVGWTQKSVNVTPYNSDAELKIMFNANIDSYPLLDSVSLLSNSPPSSTLSGTVTSSIDGTIEGASVTVVGVGSNNTNSIGYYSISDIPSGDYTVSATSATHNDYSDAITITTDTTKNFQMIRATAEITSYNTENSGTSIQVNFIGNGVTDSVKVYRDGTLLGTRATIISGNWVDSGLIEGTTYTYCLTPYDGPRIGTQVCFDAATVGIGGSYDGPGIAPSIPDVPSIPDEPPTDVNEMLNDIEEFVDEFGEMLQDLFKLEENPLRNFDAEKLRSTFEIIEEISVFTKNTTSFLFIIGAYIGATIAALLTKENEDEYDVLVNIFLFGTIGWIIPLIITFGGLINLILVNELLNLFLFMIFGFFTYITLEKFSNKEENKPIIRGRMK